MEVGMCKEIAEEARTDLETCLGGGMTRRGGTFYCRNGNHFTDRMSYLGATSIFYIKMVIWLKQTN